MRMRSGDSSRAARRRSSGGGGRQTIKRGAASRSLTSSRFNRLSSTTRILLFTGSLLKHCLRGRLVQVFELGEQTGRLGLGGNGLNLSGQTLPLRLTQDGAGMDENRDTFGLWAGAEVLHHLNPAAVGHRQVEDDHIWMGANGEFDAAAAVGGGKHLEAFEEKRFGEQFQQGGFVFDNQDRPDLLARGGAGSAERVNEPGPGQRFRRSLPSKRADTLFPFGIDGESDNRDSGWNPGAQVAQLVLGVLPGDL